MVSGGLVTILVIFHMQYFSFVYDFAQDVPSGWDALQVSPPLLTQFHWAAITFIELSFSSIIETDKETSFPGIFSVYFYSQAGLFTYFLVQLYP